MSVVGIDFGAKNTVIAAAGRGGVDVILNGNSNRLNPCMVGFDQSRTMGEAASMTASSNYKNTITNMKRLVGLAYDDPRAQREMKRAQFTCVPMKHASGGPDSIGVKVNYAGQETVVSVEAVAGMMVKHMGTISAAKAASESSNLDSNAMSTSDINNPLFPQDWVVAVPGYYTDAQKRAFLAGCEIAGVNGIQRLMHETTATALAYGIFKDIRKEFTKDTPTHVMFLDMGATAYSVSIVDFQPGKLVVKSAQHDPDLGGRDFDQLIAEWLADKFETKFRGKLSGRPMDRPKVVLKLLSAAEKAKKTLSPAGVREVHINLECLMDDLDFSVTLKADEYETMCRPLLDRLARPIERALAEANLTPSDLANVEIVGGATRVGSVKRTLATILNLDVTATNNGLSTTMNADEAVARGAALQSAILSPRFKVLPYEIIEYQPYPVKIAWEGDIGEQQQQEQGLEVDGEAEGSNLPTNSVVMFERGSNFPCVRRVTLRRSGEFRVTASYDESASEYQYPDGVSRDIATFTVQAPAGTENKIRVNVKQDIHGSITLSSAQMVEEVVEEVEEATTPPPPLEEGKGGDAAAKKEGEEEAKKEETAAPVEAKPVEKKKKVKKTNLDFTVSRPLEWTKAEMQEANEKEVSMANADRIVRETADKRNELESYIYDMRDKIISDSQLAPFCSDEEKAAFSSALETNENWLYEDGFDASKSVYAEKLGALKKLGDPIEKRQSESSRRPNAVSVLQRAVEKYKSWLNTSEGDENYEHITQEERASCHSKCDEVSSWMYDMLDKQGSLPQSADPAVTVAQIQEKSKELTDLVSPIMHKPKPKPKPKVEEKKEEEKAGDAKKAEGEAEPMDTSEDKATEEPQPEPMKE